MICAPYRGSPGRPGKEDKEFVSRAAGIAAAILGRAKEDLLSDELRQQRRNLAWAWSAAGSLAVLAAVAVWWGMIATNAQQLADANEKRALAERDKALATNGRILARDSERALAGQDPVKALLTAIEAIPAVAGDGPKVWQAERAANAALLQWTIKATVDIKRDLGDWKPVYSADGDTIIGISELTNKLNSVTIWKSPSGEEVAHYEGRRGGPRVAVLNETKRHIFVNPAVGNAGVIDLKTQVFTPIVAPGTKITNLTWSSGNHLLTIHDDGKARIWETVTAAIVQTFDLEGTSGGGLLLSDDGHRAAIELAEGELAVFDDKSKTRRCRLSHAGQPVPTDWFFGLGNRLLITARSENPFHGWSGSPIGNVWDLDTCSRREFDPKFKGSPIASIRRFAGGAMLAVSSTANDEPSSVAIWDMSTRTFTQRFDDAMMVQSPGEDMMLVFSDPEKKKGFLLTDVNSGRRVELDIADKWSSNDTLKSNPQGTRLARSQGGSQSFLVRRHLWSQDCRSCNGIWGIIVARRLQF